MKETKGNGEERRKEENNITVTHEEQMQVIFLCIFYSGKGEKFSTMLTHNSICLGKQYSKF